MYRLKVAKLSAFSQSRTRGGPDAALRVWVATPQGAIRVESLTGSGPRVLASPRRAKPHLGHPASARSEHCVNLPPRPAAPKGCKATWATLRSPEQELLLRLVAPHHVQSL